MISLCDVWPFIGMEYFFSILRDEDGTYLHFPWCNVGLFKHNFALVSKILLSKSTAHSLYDKNATIFDKCGNDN